LEVTKITRHTVPNFLNHQQPIVRPVFIQKLCYKLQALKPLHSYRLLIEILSSLLNGAMLTGSVRHNFQKLRYIRRPVWKTKSW